MRAFSHVTAPRTREFARTLPIPAARRSRVAKTAWVDFKSPLADSGISWLSKQGRVVLWFSGWGDRLDDLKRRVGEIPPGAYWRAPQPRVKSAFLCLDALRPVEDWSEAAADAPLIVDALYKVQRLHDFARELNNRVWE